MAAFIIPAIASIVGGLFSHKGQTDQINKQNALNRANEEAAQRAQYNMGRNTFERGAQGQAVRSGVGLDLLAKYFKGIDPALAAKLRIPTAYPNFEFAPGQQQAAPGWSGTAGNFLTGIAPYLGMNGNQDNQVPLGYTSEKTGYSRGSSSVPNAPTYQGGVPWNQEVIKPIGGAD